MEINYGAYPNINLKGNPRLIDSLKPNLTHMPAKAKALIATKQALPAKIRDPPRVWTKGISIKSHAPNFPRASSKYHVYPHPAGPRQGEQPCHSRRISHNHPNKTTVCYPHISDLQTNKPPPFNPCHYI
ncbi:hypothetical protein DSO57_1020632 [Entomophthora muscae]|uniref:Uncharacterized protein n=1 Tax=Entomophthora muscae TaxID=34485 RepID=A0ACC2S5S9_9FUNG|nr:hypothetical protein DSO57_1020632 [Entomophthora muscae]